ncbi:MAG: hypothetical protein WBL72_08445 [Thermoguttaceae bacterium]
MLNDADVLSRVPAGPTTHATELLNVLVAGLLRGIGDDFGGSCLKSQEKGKRDRETTHDAAHNDAPV